MKVKSVILAAGAFMILGPAAVSTQAGYPREITGGCSGTLLRAYRQYFECIGAIERIMVLRRVMTNEEREQMRLTLSPYQGQMERFQLRLRELRTRALTSDPSFCTDVEAVDRELARALRSLRSYENTVRRTVFTARHAMTAIRVTDGLLTRAMAASREGRQENRELTQLRTAWELQENAKQSLARRQVALAIRQTLRAREMLSKSLGEPAGATDSEELRTRTRTQLEHTQTMLEQLRLSLSEGDNEGTHRMLQLAERHMEQARAHLQNGQSDAAMRESEAARRTVALALRVRTATHDIDSRIAQVEASVSRAREIIEQGDNPAAEELVESAEQHLADSKELAENGQQERASAALATAAKLAARAVDMAKPVAARQRLSIEAEIRKTLRIIAQAKSQALDSRHRTLVMAAEKLVERARNHKGDTSETLALLDKATDMAFEVLRETRDTQETPANMK